MIDFNTEPYNDDFDEDNKFYRVLFRPAFAVQARELTQLQTILQNQVSRQGSHLFKQGSMVIPGQISIDTKAQYVRLKKSYGTSVTETFIQTLVGSDIVGTSGLKAKIIKVVSATTTDETTVFIRYNSSATDGTTKVFAEDEVITTLDGAYTFQAFSTNATGTGSTATIQRGIYYINGFFVLCADPVTGDEQTIVLDKYGSEPTYRVGLQIIESVIVPEDDETLLDNAQTSYNFAAPGAHRYHIDLILTKKLLDDEDDEDFIQLLQVGGGTLKRIVNKTAYSELEKTFARRTFDESGDYDIRPFVMDVREARTNNRGDWVAAAAVQIGDVVKHGGNFYTAKNAGSTVSIPPVHTSGTSYDGPGSTGINWEYTDKPLFNRGISLLGSSDQLALALDPGKAYVQGYEIEKIATEYVYIDKCRDTTHQVSVDNAYIPATIGNYVLVNNLNSIPRVDTFATVTLYDQYTVAGRADTTGKGASAGSAVGTARVRGIEWHNGTIGSDAAQYKLMLFDIKMNSGKDFNSNVKSFYYNNPAGGAVVDFTADVVPLTTLVTGSVTASASTTLTGSGTSFTSAGLVAGDYVLLGDTEIRRITATPSSQTSLTVDRAVTVSGVQIRKITTEIKEPGNEVSVFKFPYYMIKTARATDATNQITYTVAERYTGTTGSSNGTTCLLSVSTSSGQMGSAAETDNYQLVDNTTGRTVPIDPSNITVSGSSVTFTLDGTTSGGKTDYSARSFTVIGTVTKTLSANTEKTKTLTLATPVTFTTQAAATAPELSLGVADGYRLISVKQATGFAFGSSPTDSDYTEDVSDRYDFDDGQTSTYYGISKLRLKPSFAPPNAPVRVEFEYFDHGTGDYFTVNSYTNISYKDIPVFQNYALRDCIDFRPRISSDGVTFDGSGGSLSLIPKRGYDIQADFTYYIGRKVKIAVDFNGNFFALNGVPSLNPGEPADPSIGMVLYTVELEPYTLSTGSRSVSVKKHDNKRYTMRDIGKLEKRIDTLEYYTSLTMLEQETQSLEIIDPATGLNRFKNGFIVDNFSGHKTGDTGSSDYFCSIDMENNELRPFYSMKNINLIEKNSTSLQRTSSNYKLYGDVITLPLDATTPHVVLVDQPYASRLENINPFAIFTFLGDVKITPSSDEWFETDRRPDIIQNVEGDFDTIQALAEKAGVLGTVWNAWQTQWSGVQTRIGSESLIANKGAGDASGVNTSAAALDARFGVGPEAAGWARRVLTTDTFAETGVASRTGVNTRIVAKIDRRQVDDRVVSTAVIPYIRSRNILVQSSGLKPSTTFKPYFDNVNVSAYCTPATKITYGGTGVFNTDVNVGGNATEDTRRVNGDTQVCLNKGDVITGSTSGATAVVVGSEKVYNTAGTTVTSRALYVVNIKGTFSNGETFTGSISGATGTVSSVGTIGTAGGNITTNENGEAHFLFNIPNTDSIRFRTGQRQFVLTDSPTNAFDYTSRGISNYYASGVLESKQATIVATRNAELVREPTAGNMTVVRTSDRLVSDTGWYDPLAQTFMVQSTGGCFLSKVDVFFATKDTKIPVMIEIREVVNGYPGKLILPFSRMTKKPEDVNISTNTVTLNGVETPSYDTATTFEFPSPVYVQNNTEYALVIMSDSNNYKVWISNMGDKIPNSSRTISEQPYAGVLFKSQNGSTWTANQDQDLKFTLYRAKFNTSVIGSVQLVNDVNPKTYLDKDPFETNTGVAKVKVYQPNHGFTAGSKVTLENSVVMAGVAGTSGTIVCNTGSTTVTGTGTVFTTDMGTTTVGQGTVLYTAGGTYIGVVASVASNTSLTLVANAATTVTGSATGYKFVDAINGVPATEVYKTHTIAAIVDHESYVVTTTTTAKNKGYAGGITIQAQQNYQYNAVHPIAAVQTFSDTPTTFAIKTTSGKGANGSQTAYDLDTGFTGIIPNETNYFKTPRLVASEENEQFLLSGNKSVTMECKISSSNNALSPILDLHRMSLTGISNTINSPSETSVNQAGLDEVALITSDATIGFTAASSGYNAKLYSTDATARGLLRTITVGKYITISGAASALNGSTASPKTVLVTDVTDDGTTCTVTVYNNTGATASAGASVSIVVRNHFIEEISPLGSSSHSKYVTKKIKLETAATTLKIRLAANVPTSSNLAIYYKTSPVGSKTVWEKLNYTYASPDSPLIKVENGNPAFYDVNFTITNMTPFEALAIKLVMTSTNTSEVPRVKDLRVVACS